MPQFSVVIPVYNEESNLEELHRRLDSVFKEIGSNMELIFCDDGSHDGTPQIIAELHEKDPRVKCLRLSRNFGQQAALLCGLHHASGEAVILMDADLQDPPETIPSMVEKMREGFDVVTCVRASRPEAFIKRMAYNIFYKLLSSISYFPIAPHVGDFSIMRRNVVNAITDISDAHPFIRGLRSWVGFRQTSIIVERQSRHTGVAKYNFSKLFELALTGIFSFSRLPARLSSFLGFSLMIICGLYTLWVLTARIFFGQLVAGWTSLMIATLLVGGIQLFMLGVMGEYVFRIFEETKGRPPYLVSEKIGWPSPVSQLAEDSKGLFAGFEEESNPEYREDA